MNDDKQARLLELRKKIQRTGADYRRLFQSEVGKKVLADLEETFFNQTVIVPGDPYLTHAKAGGREVFIYIKQMMEINTGEDDG